MLEEDALRFDQFLKDNDQKAVAAIKKAEAETKAKAEKVQEIKKLNMQITQIKSEMSKFEEQLEDCRKYKDFLDRLTPQEHFEQAAAQRVERKNEKKRIKMVGRQQELEEQAVRDKEAMAAQLVADRAKKGRRSRKEKEQDEIKEKEIIDGIVAKTLTVDDISSDEETEEDKEVPMFFTYPQQLLDIFTQLEESNLFLIQNSQETEAALEELKTKFAETRAEKEAESEALTRQIAHLEEQIRAEEEKSTALGASAGMGSGRAGVAEQEAQLEELNRKVAEVYRAIFSEADNSLSTLQMLTNIEARLEELLLIIDGMPPAEVEAAEKQKEKERRAHFRELKQLQQQQAQEERIQRSIRRSQEPVKRRTGKPIMFRSVLPQRKAKAVDDDANKYNEEDDVNFYLSMPDRF